MATLAGNSWYVLLDTVDVSAYVQNVKITPKHNAVETTAGSGTTHITRSSGLIDYTASLSIVYDSTNVPVYIQKIAAGQQITLEYGPEGQTAGKPRHQQVFLLDGAPIEQDVSKKAVVFDCSLTQAAAPQVNMYTGGTY